MHHFLVGFKAFAKKDNNSHLLILAAVFTAVSVVFYYFFQQFYEETLVEQTQHRQQLIARSGAKSIETFIDLAGTHTYHLSQRTDIINNTLKADEILVDYLNSFSEYPIKGIVLTDRGGRVLKSSNVANARVSEANLSDRVYFNALVQDPTQRYVVSMPTISKLGATAGQYILVVAAPVIKDGQFDGVVASSILISELTENYLNPLKLGNNTEIYLMDKNGLIISSSVSSLLGTVYHNNLGNEEFKEEVQVPEGYSLKPGRYLVASSPVRYRAEENWNLAVSSPIDYALIFGTKLERFGWLTLLYIIFIILSLSVYYLEKTRVAK